MTLFPYTTLFRSKQKTAYEMWYGDWSSDVCSSDLDEPRERAGLSGVTARQTADAVVVTTSSSRYVARNYWRDPTSGVDYQVEVLVPTPRMNSPQQVETIPLRTVNPDLNLLIRDVAKVGKGVMPGEIDRSTMQRYVSITANVEIGRASCRERVSYHV